MLKKLKPIATKLIAEFNGKYAYYEAILNAYLENGDFILTITRFNKNVENDVKPLRNKQVRIKRKNLNLNSKENIIWIQ